MHGFYEFWPETGTKTKLSHSVTCGEGRAIVTTRLRGCGVYGGVTDLDGPARSAASALHFNTHPPAFCIKKNRKQNRLIRPRNEADALITLEGPQLHRWGEALATDGII